MTRPTTLRPTLTPTVRAELVRWARGQVRPHAEVQRAQLVLLVADGWSVTEAAAEVGLSRLKGTAWLKRFAVQGVTGLKSQRRGRPGSSALRRRG